MNNFVPFSEKQLAALTWWCETSPVKNKNGIICDGAVRSGKTLCMSISFMVKVKVSGAVVPFVQVQPLVFVMNICIL